MLVCLDCLLSCWVNLSWLDVNFKTKIHECYHDLGMSTLRPSPCPCNSFSCYSSIWFFLHVLSIRLFFSKLFCFFCWFVIVHWLVDLLVEFSFVILEGLFFALFDTVQVFFEFSFFRQYFLFISSNCIVRLVLVHCILACFSFLISFTCCRNFFICPNRISHPNFYLCSDLEDTNFITD